MGIFRITRVIKTAFQVISSRIAALWSEPLPSFLCHLWAKVFSLGSRLDAWAFAQRDLETVKSRGANKAPCFGYRDIFSLSCMRQPMIVKASVQMLASVILLMSECFKRLRIMVIRILCLLILMFCLGSLFYTVYLQKGATLEMVLSALFPTGFCILYLMFRVIVRRNQWNHGTCSFGKLCCLMNVASTLGRAGKRM